jgi:integrase
VAASGKGAQQWHLDKSGVRRLNPRLNDRLLPLEIVYFAKSSNYRTKRHPDGQWVAHVTVKEASTGAKKRSVPKAFGDDAAAAVAHLEELRKQRQAADDLKNAPTTLGDVFDHVKRTIWSKKAKTTFDSRVSRWERYAKAYWEQRPLEKITRGEAQTWFSANEGRIPPGQLKELKTELFALGQRFGDVDADQEDRRNPFDEIILTRRPGRHKTTIVSSSWDPLKTVCFLLAQPGFAGEGRSALVERFVVEMWLTSLHTGLRFGEVIPLSVAQLDLTKGILVVDRAMRVHHREIVPGIWQEVGEVKPWALHLPKGGLPDPERKIRRERRIPISAKAAAILAPIVEQAKDAGTSLLWPDADGHPKEKKNVVQAFTNLRCRLHEVGSLSCPSLAECWPTIPTTRGRATNIVVDHVRLHPEIAIPNIFEHVLFRDARSSFSTYCNDLRMTDATRNDIMGHLPEGVGARHYVEITDTALAGARRLLSGID